MPKRLPRLVGSFHLIGVACRDWPLVDAFTLALATSIAYMAASLSFILAMWILGPPVGHRGTQFGVFTAKYVVFICTSRGDLVNRKIKAHIPLAACPGLSMMVVRPLDPFAWGPAVHGPADPTGARVRPFSWTTGSLRVGMIHHYQVNTPQTSISP